MAVAILELVVVCCSNEGHGLVTVDSLAEVVELTVSQRSPSEHLQVVESVLTLTLRESPLDHADWFVEHVAVSFRPTLSPWKKTPTGFESESLFHTSGSRLDSRRLTPGVSREFAEEVPHHDPGEDWEVLWELQFANHKTREQITLSTGWSLVH